VNITILRQYHAKRAASTALPGSFSGTPSRVVVVQDIFASVFTKCALARCLTFPKTLSRNRAGKAGRASTWLQSSDERLPMFGRSMTRQKISQLIGTFSGSDLSDNFKPSVLLPALKGRQNCNGGLPMPFPLSPTSRFRAWTGRQIIEHRAQMRALAAERAKRSPTTNDSSRTESTLDEHDRRSVAARRAPAK
jgi:hypothetical protein